MKDYIREILEEVNDIQVRYTKPLLVKNYTDRDCAIGSYEKLVCKMINMITNLQEENEKLKAPSNYYQYASKSVKNNCESLQQRIDKAIELLEDDYFEDGSGNNIDNVISILRGEDNE